MVFKTTLFFRNRFVMYILIIFNEKIIMKKEPTYKEKVFEYLDRMDIGTKLLTDLCTHETKPKFIETVKLYIDKKGKGENGYVVEFNSDWTAIKKFDIVLKTSIQEFKESI